MIRLLLVDDHVMLREGIRSMLADHKDICIEGEVGSAAEMFACLKKNRFDVIILDIKLTDASGVALLQRIKRLQPKVKVIMLTMFDQVHYAIHALQSGADAYVVKGATTDELLEAIHDVRRGKTYVSASMASKLAGWVRPGRGDTELDALSHREFEVLTMLGRGLSVKEIAAHLTVSQKSVTTYRSRLMQKLHLSNNAEIVKFAVNSLLVD